MNAAKKLRQMLLQGDASEQTKVLVQLVSSLQFGVPFDMRALSSLDEEYYQLGMRLLEDWREEHHIATRSKLVDDILARNRSLGRQLCSLQPLPAEAISA